MRDYLMNITGAVLISVFCDVLLPDKWSKYVKTITGLMITAAIISPLGSFNIIPDMSGFISEAGRLEEEGEQVRNNMILEELEKNIEEDIRERFLKEFNREVSADVSVETNSDNEITGVKSIRLTGNKIDENMINRINEIYAPTEVYIDEG
ncbi:MAG: stage III sporulation protein AF [Clostridia bacterium]|nr:stage III sporulation protein AF [Clostridia bacterium]